MSHSAGICLALGSFSGVGCVNLSAYTHKTSHFTVVVAAAAPEFD